jgi:hypothetical protein
MSAPPGQSTLFGTIASLPSGGASLPAPGGDRGTTFIRVQFNTLVTPETARELIASFPGLQLDSMFVAPRRGPGVRPGGCGANLDCAV